MYNEILTSLFHDTNISKLPKNISMCLHSCQNYYIDMHHYMVRYYICIQKIYDHTWYWPRLRIILCHYLWTILVQNMHILWHLTFCRFPEWLKTFPKVAKGDYSRDHSQSTNLTPHPTLQHPASAHANKECGPWSKDGSVVKQSSWLTGVWVGRKPLQYCPSHEHCLLFSFVCFWTDLKEKHLMFQEKIHIS